MFTTLAPPRRLAKSEVTITAILKAAARLFVLRSYAEVTMHDIARSARLTKGAVYHHFESKEQVYVAMLRSGLALRGEKFASALAAGQGCRDRLRNLVAYFLSLTPPERGVMRLVRRDINLFAAPIRTQLVRAYQEALPQAVERVLERGMADGELKQLDARLLSWQFVALVEVMLNEYASRRFAREAQIDYVIDLFFSGAAAGQGVSHHA